MGQTDIITILRLISDRLRFGRTKVANLSATEAAKALQVDRRTLHRWENGRPPSYAQLHRAALLYQIDWDWLLTGLGTHQSEAFLLAPTKWPALSPAEQAPLAAALRAGTLRAG